MNAFRQLPMRARTWMAAVWAVAIVLLVTMVPDIARWHVEDLGSWISLSALAALLEQFTVKVAHGSEDENYSLTDALWVPVMIFARPSVLALAVATGVAVGQIARRWAWFKITYNVAQFVISALVARTIFDRFDVTVRPISLTMWLAASLAMLAYFVLNESFIAFVISLAAGVRFRTLLVLPHGLNVLQAGGNLTIGLLAALVWSSGPVGIPLLLAPMVLVFMAYRGWLHAKREEEQARDRDRMQALYEAGRELSGPLDPGYDFRAFLSLIRKMLDASEVELVLVEGDVRVFNSAAGLILRSPHEDPPVPPREYVSTRPRQVAFIAPVGDERAGVLAVHRQSPLTAAEGSLVEALAAQIKVRGENERLLRQTVEQKSHLADVIGHTSDGIFEVSAERVLLSWNPAMERITGIPSDAALDRSCDEVLGLTGDGALEEGASTTLRLDDPTPQDVLIARSDGKARWIRYTSSPMLGGDLELKGFVIIARDVTAELEAERLKSDFVATVSHELRTPLTPLKGFIGALRNNLVDDSAEARQEYYEIMWRSVGRLERLIAELLDVSRVEAGKLTLEPETIELAPLLDACVRQAQAEFGYRPVTILSSAGSPLVLADRFRLDQILTNLLSNAFKYSTADTSIDVMIARKDAHVRIAVHNEGEGIPRSDQQAVFNRFYRAQSGLTREIGGVGLGLFLCKWLVEAMGGQIGVESLPDQGCTFWFTIPIAGHVEAATRVRSMPASAEM